MAQQLQLAWLAGLLEAEGTFLRAVPSKARSPCIACFMTDRDVVQRVATLFGTGCFEHRRSERVRPVFTTRLRGARAALLMHELLPLMGARRSASIVAALEAYQVPARKLGFQAAAEIRSLATRNDVTVSELSRKFEVARSTIRQVRDGRIYKPSNGLLWRREVVLPLVYESFAGVSQSDLYWLAGWLEGEGSFVRPPPSDSRRARILGCTRDQDVAARVARLMAVSPHLTHPERDRLRGWSPLWRILMRGSGGF